LIHSHVEAPEKPDADSAPVAARSRARICIYLGVCLGEGGSCEQSELADDTR
jgi:hypothetical protein